MLGRSESAVFQNCLTNQWTDWPTFRPTDLPTVVCTSSVSSAMWPKIDHTNASHSVLHVDVLINAVFVTSTEIFSSFHGIWKWDLIHFFFVVSLQVTPSRRSNRISRQPKKVFQKPNKKKAWEDILERWCLVNLHNFSKKKKLFFSSTSKAACILCSGFWLSIFEVSFCYHCHIL